MVDELGGLFERPPSHLLTIGHASIASGPLSFDASDEFAATHYRIFCHELVPAASVFLEPHTMMGGAVSDSFWQYMTANGYDPDTRSIPADHLATGFRFLGYLLKSGYGAAAKRFVQHYLMSWIPVFLDRLKRENDIEMARLAGFVEEVVDHILLAEAGTSAAPLFSPPVLSESSFDIQSDRTGLQDIGQFFASHVESGLFIPRSQLLIQARRHRLPTGFGSRARTIEGLFRSAGQYDSMDAVCAFMVEEIDIHRTLWDEWSAKGVAIGAAPWAKAWIQKLEATRAVVTYLRTAPL